MGSDKFPTHGDNNDFLAGAPNAPKQTFTARDVLTYLYAESKWDEDVDGDIDGPRVNHNIRIRDGLLEELLDMSGIPRGRYDETPLERLARANEEDQRASRPQEAERG